MSPILARLTLYLTIVGGLLAAAFMGSALGSEDYSTVILIFGSVIGILWVVNSGDHWWWPLPVAMGLGGVFYVPFKLYPHELALLFAGVALLPRIPFKPTGLRKFREPLPLPFYILFAYLVVHTAVSLFAFRETGGLGNISRAYFNALWPLLFGFFFYKYGTTRTVPGAFRLLYFALLVRVALGLANFYFDDIIVVPGINYALDNQDLRSSGNMLMILSGLAWAAATNPVLKIWHATLCLTSMVTWLALGGSRGQLVITVVFAGLLAFLHRRYATLFVFGALVVIGTMVINIAPTVIEPLPYRLQRALTGLMVAAPNELEVQDDVKGSSQFRQVISQEGYRRWTTSPMTVVLGTGMRPFDEAFFASAMRFEVEAFTLLIQNAADVGAYETAMWTVLAVTGVTGAILYIWFIVVLIIPVARGVRAGVLQGHYWIVTAWGACSLICYLLFSPLSGGFPQLEMFLAFVALVCVRDLVPVELLNPGKANEDERAPLARGPAGLGGRRLPALEDAQVVAPR